MSEFRELEDPAAAPQDAPVAKQAMRSAAIKGGRWTLLENLAVQGLSFVVTLILARILAPEEFGLIAAVTLAANFFGLLGNVGLSASIIQRSDASEVRVSSVFWAGLGLATVLTGILMALTGPLANSMNLPEAQPLMMVAAAQLAAAILSTIPEALLLRRLAFRTAAMVSVGSFMIYPPIAIGLAVVFDMGAWAVVIGQALRPVAKFFLGMIAARWHPRFMLDWSMVRKDIAFNGGFFLVAGTGFLIKNMDYWVVSRFLGGALLGVYYMAFVIPTIVRQRLTWALGRVLLPVLSRVRHDRDRFVRAFVDTSQFIALITLPAMVGLLLVAEPLVHVVLGSRWADAVAPLGVLALAAACDSMAQVPLQGFVAEGTPMRAFLFAGPRVIVLAIGLTIAISGPGTLLAVAWAVFASSFTNFALAQVVAVTRMSIPAGRLLAGYRPVVLPVLAMAAAVGGTGLVFDRLSIPQIVELATLLVVGAASYLGVGMLLSRRVFRRLLHDGKTLIGRGPKPASGEPAGAPAA